MNDNLPTDPYADAAEDPRGREPVFNMPGVVTAAILLMAAIEAVKTYLLSDADIGRLMLEAAVIPARYTETPVDGAWFWSPVTYSLVHGGWLHLVINAFWLAAFAFPLVLLVLSLAEFAVLPPLELLFPLLLLLRAIALFLSPCFAPVNQVHRTMTQNLIALAFRRDERPGRVRPILPRAGIKKFLNQLGIRQVPPRIGPAPSLHIVPKEKLGGSVLQHEANDFLATALGAPPHFREAVFERLRRQTLPHVLLRQLLEIGGAERRLLGHGQMALPLRVTHILLDVFAIVPHRMRGRPGPEGPAMRPMFLKEILP